MVQKQWNGCYPNKVSAKVPWFERKRRLCLNIKESKLPTADHVQLLGVENDCKLTFNKHIEMLCSKVNIKVSAFVRLSNYISRKQALTVLMR